MLDQDLLESINEGDHIDGPIADIHNALKTNPKTIIILDDDPTGTQTVYDVPVITQWDESVLEAEIINSPVFFILTNSRSLQVDEANNLAELLGKRLHKLSQKHNKNILVVSRGDSTLRGHYPNEVDALAQGLETKNAKHVLAPAFFEGGRYTYKDTHYVRESNHFIPSGETPFAKDNTFGYTASNLKDWIVEKYEGDIDKDKIESISIDLLRQNNSEVITEKIKNPNHSHVIVNATSYCDLQKFAIACLQNDEQLLFRTSASFVNAISGIEAKNPLSKEEILGRNTKGAGLIVVGSYVPKTSAQLDVLKEKSNAVFLELDVSNVRDNVLFTHDINALAETINSHLESHINVVLYTSRTIIKGNTKAESLTIVNRVSNGVISIVKQLKTKPKYIVAKGGITSSDVATKGLNVKRAKVIGQVIKGVPVWQLGKETKFPDTPYIVFPGNVGDEDALYKLTKLLE